MTVQLPLYIQKNIIKILCKHIDRNNRLMDIVGMDNTWYRKNEKVIKTLMIKIALVSHDWFKTLSNNLSVSVDFNYKERDDKWSIIKQDNVKILKLHYTHKDNQVYTNMNGEITEIPLEIVNKKLENLTKSPSGLFKTLKFRNLNVKSTPSANPFPVINSLYDCNWGIGEGNRNLHIYEIVLNRSTILQDIRMFEEKVKRIFSISIDKCVNKKVISKSFELYYKKLIGLELFYILSTRFSLCDILVSGSHNYLSNITLFDMSDPNLTIKECISIFKSALRIERFRVNICFKNLIYFLSTVEERLQDTSIQRCTCDGIIERKETIVNDEEQQEFNEQWLEFKQLVNNHKTLYGLLFNCECTISGGALDIERFPDAFVNEIVSLVSPCKSLREFTFISSVTSQIFKELAKHNKTITHYDASSVDNGTCNFELITNEFNQIITENQHIQTFKYAKQTYNYETLEYDVHSLLDYKKE